MQGSGLRLIQQRLSCLSKVVQGEQMSSIMGNQSTKADYIPFVDYLTEFMGKTSTKDYG